jgi:hypothetical protein
MNECRLRKEVKMHKITQVISVLVFRCLKCLKILTVLTLTKIPVMRTVHIENNTYFKFSNCNSNKRANANQTLPITDYSDFELRLIIAATEHLVLTDHKAVISRSVDTTNP